VTARSKSQVCGRLPTEIVRSNAPPEAWRFVIRECRVLSGKGLYDWLITHPEESYRLWCVVVCDLETSWMRRSWPIGDCHAKIQSKQITVQWEVNIFDTQFVLLNFSGTLGLPSSGSLYANAGNAFKLIQCVKHRHTSNYLRRSVKTLTSWASGSPLTYGPRLWSPFFGKNGAKIFLLYCIEHFNILQLM
jgi:hypothetical protein